jgi:hypothetical protein
VGTQGEERGTDLPRHEERYADKHHDSKRDRDTVASAIKTSVHGLHLQLISVWGFDASRPHSLSVGIDVESRKPADVIHLVD